MSNTKVVPREKNWQQCLAIVADFARMTNTALHEVAIAIPYLNLVTEAH